MITKEYVDHLLKQREAEELMGLMLFSDTWEVGGETIDVKNMTLEEKTELLNKIKGSLNNGKGENE